MGGDMEEEEEVEAAALPDPSLFSTDDEEDRRRHPRQQRSICWSGCMRPNSTCICPFLPPSPIPTSTHLLILHHPHSLRANKLSTLPALAYSLLNFHPVLGRRLLPSSSPLLDRRSPSSPLLLLFPSFNPSSPALNIESWAFDTPPAARLNPVLVVFDATWRHAKEMVAASMPFLSRFSVQVQIGDGCDTRLDGPSTFESGFVLRKEPWKGCLSTVEAVARALRVLEPEGRGVEVERRLLCVLEAMVAFQACHMKMVKPRNRLKKKARGVGSNLPSV